MSRTAKNSVELSPEQIFEVIDALQEQIDKLKAQIGVVEDPTEPAEVMRERINELRALEARQIRREAIQRSKNGKLYELAFNVGPHLYTLSIQHQLLESAHDDKTKEITLSDEITPAERWDLLLRELRQAWLTCLPKPKNQGQEEQLSAMVVGAAVRDLEGQGGRDALEKLQATIEE